MLLKGHSTLGITWEGAWFVATGSTLNLSAPVPYTSVCPLPLFLPFALLALPDGAVRGGPPVSALIAPPSLACARPRSNCVDPSHQAGASNRASCCCGHWPPCCLCPPRQSSPLNA